MLHELETLVGTGNWAAAREACLSRIRSEPSDSGAHRYLALVHQMSGAPLVALQAAERACVLAPLDPRCWSDRGRVHALQGQFAEAARCFHHAVRVDPGYADGWHNLGLASRELGSSDAAFAALKNALLIDSTRADTYLALGNLLVEADQFDDAVECFERAAKQDPSLARARSRLAFQMSMRGRVVRAEKLFRESLGLDPDHLPGWLGLARVLEDIGEAQGALNCYRNVLAREPRQPLALGQYLALSKDCAERGRDGVASYLDIARTALADSKTNDEARALIGYGLLKYYDRRGEYEKAAQAGLAANAARRRVTGSLDREALVMRVDGIIATCTREFFKARRQHGQGTDQPVFIVGLPRSGTTLTEQILSQHPKLHGAGELPDLARVAAASVAADGAPWEAVKHLDEMQSRVRAGEYLQALRAGAPRGRLRIIDKSPLNFFHLGLVAVLFPNARIIHCRRGARDNALSIWMENFNAGQQHATDFDDLAFYTAQYRRLMAHWHEHLPLKMINCVYEDTVADLEKQARRLVEFMGVAWDAKCLQFHRSERAVQTPSRWQVRQPVYRSSVGRWKKYEQWLPGLIAAFGAED